MREKIIPHLEEGCFVICDRFNDSTIAYQGYGFGMDISNLETISSFATINKEPDITFFLDISVSLSLNRRNNIENDRIESKGAQYLEKVRQGFLSISNVLPYSSLFTFAYCCLSGAESLSIAHVSPPSRDCIISVT